MICHLGCTFHGSLAHTGKGHGSDKGVIFGLHGYQPKDLIDLDAGTLFEQLCAKDSIKIANKQFHFDTRQSIIFDRGPPLKQHPNGMVFRVLAGSQSPSVVAEETFFSIGGGFICNSRDISKECIEVPLRYVPYPFASAKAMLHMARKSQLSIAEMKRQNELHTMSKATLNQKLDEIWQAMKHCVEKGLAAGDGCLPGGLKLRRRAQLLHTACINEAETTINDWLCAYAIAVNEENAAGSMVVTAPTNGAAGVIPAVLYYCYKHRQATKQQIRDYLLTAAAIGGIIKHNSSISGAEVGCQGEVGSAASMAAGGVCALLSGTPEQVENAAEIALEHHLGTTCDPVGGLVQVPCIERNGFGAIKAFAAAQLAKRGSGSHFMPLDNCIAAMKQTGQEMLEKYKETSLGGLAVNLTEC